MKVASAEKHAFMGRSLLLLSLLVISITTVAQPLTESNWIFGSSELKLHFNKQRQTLSLDTLDFPLIDSRGGSVVANDDETGDLIFYADHDVLIDAFDGSETILEPSNVNILNIDQPVAACKSPQDDELFFLLHHSSVSNDLGLFRLRKTDRITPLSILTPGRTILDSVPSITSGMILFPLSTSTYCLITQDTTRDFRVSYFSGNNVNTGFFDSTRVFSIFNDSLPSFEAQNFSFSASSNRIAVSPKTNNRNVLVLLVDSATGHLSFEQQILNTANSDNNSVAISDTEWSVDGEKIFISRRGSGASNVADVYFLDFADTINTTITGLRGGSLFRSLGLKRGPDSVIYHLYQQDNGGPIMLGSITGDSLTTIEYEENIFNNLNLSANQFPEFAPSRFFGFRFDSIEVVGTCYINSQSVNNTNLSMLIPRIEPTPTSFHWEIGPDTESTAHTPVVELPIGQTIVRLTVSLNGYDTTIAVPVNIQQRDTEFDLGNDTTICPGETLVLPQTGEDNPSFLYGWSTGETTSSITVDSSGTYWVSVDMGGGCTIYDEIEVEVYLDTAEEINTWYFGERAGIRWIDRVAEALPDSNQMNAPEGCAIISDEFGNMLFYTNGATVWNRNHEVMTGSSNLTSDSLSSQSALIVRSEHDPTIFYIFHTDEVYGDQTFNLSYSIVDIKLSSFGEVIVANIPLLSNSTERLTGAEGTNTNYLVSHEFGNNYFRTFAITEDGIGGPYLSNTGSDHRFNTAQHGKGYMKYNLSSGNLAVPIAEGSSSSIELFQVTSEGEVHNPIALRNLNGTIYGIEFSSGGNILYASTNNTLYQFELDTIDNSMTAEQRINGTREELDLGINDLGALQIGPDNIIYGARDNNGSLATISTPGNREINRIGFIPDGFDLEGRISRRGLPNFFQTFSTSSGAGIAVTNACFGVEAQFSGVEITRIDEYLWSFGDGQSANVRDTLHGYAEPGIYGVSLNITNRCGLDTTFFETVSMNQEVPDPTNPELAFLCDSTGALEIEALTENAVTPILSYFWSTGDTSRVITVNETGAYSVYLEDTSGCRSLEFPTQVTDGRPSLELGNDQFYCSDGDIPDLDDRSPLAESHTWYINGIPTGNRSQTQPILRDSTGTNTYGVTIVSQATGCSNYDSVFVTIYEDISLLVTGTNSSACAASDASISLTVNETGDFSFQLLSLPDSTVVTGPLSFQGPFNNITNVNAGLYRVIVSDLVTTCDSIIDLSVEDELSTFAIDSLGVVPGCQDSIGIEIRLAGVNGNTAPLDFQVNLTLAGGPTNTFISNGTDSTISIVNLSSGQYLISVIELGGDSCIQDTTITLNAINPTEFTLTANDLCRGPGVETTLEVSNFGSATNFIWDGPGITNLSTNSIQDISENGRYYVRVNGDGLCEGEDSIDVVITDQPDISFTVTGDSCSGQVTLTSQLVDTIFTNEYLFTWQRNDTLLSTGNQIVASESGNYQVKVSVENINEVCQDSANQDVLVFDQLEVNIGYSPNCDEHPTALLTALPRSFAGVGYSWELPDRTISKGRELIISDSGLYKVTVAYGDTLCPVSDSANFILTPIDDDELLLAVNGNNAVFCSIDSTRSPAILDAGQFSSYSWRIAGQPGTVFLSNPFITTVENKYVVEVSNGFTCRTDHVLLSEDCLLQIATPNIFSPKATIEGNRVFKIFKNDMIENFEIFIFNRWGELMYYSNDVDFEWDGTYSGRLLPTNVFAYKIRFTHRLKPDMGTIEQLGSVTLLR